MRCTLATTGGRAEEARFACVPSDLHPITVPPTVSYLIDWLDSAMSGRRGGPVRCSCSCAFDGALLPASPAGQQWPPGMACRARAAGSPDGRCAQT